MAKKKEGTTITKREELLIGIKAKVEDLNEATKFAEFKRIKDLEKEISEDVDTYTEEMKKECFAELKKADNPLRACAEKIFFTTVKVGNKRLEGGATKKVVEENGTIKWIDPLELHNEVEGGIGVNKNWHFMVQKLNKHLLGRKKIELGVKTDSSDFAIDDEALGIEGFLDSSIDVFRSEEHPERIDNIKHDEYLKENLQMLVDAMVGEGVRKVTTEDVSTVLDMYTRKSNRSILTLISATHLQLRQMMLEICYGVITGEKTSIDYKKKAGRLPA